jgi:hypothetical protein
MDRVYAGCTLVLQSGAVEECGKPEYSWTLVEESGCACWSERRLSTAFWERREGRKYEEKTTLEEWSSRMVPSDAMCYCP